MNQSITKSLKIIKKYSAQFIVLKISHFEKTKELLSFIHYVYQDLLLMCFIHCYEYYSFSTMFGSSSLNAYLLKVHG